jgi:hypothetical protein
MASERTDSPTGQESNQSSSESKSSEEAQSKTTQDQSSDPSTVEILGSTVTGSAQLTDPATKEHLQNAK